MFNILGPLSSAFLTLIGGMGTNSTPMSPIQTECRCQCSSAECAAILAGELPRRHHQFSPTYVGANGQRAGGSRRVIELS